MASWRGWGVGVAVSEEDCDDMAGWEEGIGLVVAGEEAEIVAMVVLSFEFLQAQTSCFWFLDTSREIAIGA